MACVEHGDFDELEPYPGQGLMYSVLIGKNDHYSLVGPINTTEGIDQAKFYAQKLGYGVHGTYSMSSLGDLLGLAQGQGLLQGPPPATEEKLPRSLINAQVHEPECAYAAQGHPGKCYVRTPGVNYPEPYEVKD